MMNVVIFEDENHNAERLVQLLEKTGRNINVTAVISSVEEGIQWLNNNGTADLILMDIQLSDGNCFEILEKADIKLPVIFTTAYDNFTLKAFKHNSIDYLMKPIELGELQAALAKFETLRPANTVDISKIANAFFKRSSARLLVKINNQLIYVKAPEIAYIQVIESTPYIYTFSGQKLPLDYTLDHVADTLDPHSFFRVNRQFMVNIDAIQKISSYFNSRLILKLQPDTNEQVIVSREKVAAFKDWLEGK